MGFLQLPAWLQIALAAEAITVLSLTARFGWRGLVWSVLAAAAFWFVFGFGASYLVGRLEGGKAAELSGLVSGSLMATGRLSLIAAPLVALAAVLGLALRRLSSRKRKGA